MPLQIAHGGVQMQAALVVQIGFHRLHGPLVGAVGARKRALGRAREDRDDVGYAAQSRAA